MESSSHCLCYEKSSGVILCLFCNDKKKLFVSNNKIGLAILSDKKRYLIYRYIQFIITRNHLLCLNLTWYIPKLLYNLYLRITFDLCYGFKYSRVILITN